MTITIPELSLVLLVGASGSGKSTFARKHFAPTEVISSDHCRALVSDDENSQEATKDAFDVLRFIAQKRLAAGKLTVLDATNVQPESRKPLIALAREFHVMPVAIVLDVPEGVCHERNRQRPGRSFGPQVVRSQLQQLHRSLRGLQREGFRHVHVLKPDAIEQAVIERQPMWTNKKSEHGPFDIIGDIHGCATELIGLLRELGYRVEASADDASFEVVPPSGRKAIFLGDLVDRGPDIPTVLRVVMGMVRAGSALCVPGNHEVKLLRKLSGRDVKVSHGLAQSLAQLEADTPEFRREVMAFIDGLVSHYVLDDGKLVVAHAGMKESMQGRGSSGVREFAIYGETSGETDEYGLPVRYDWAAEYRGKAKVVYGHTPVPAAEWLNDTICIDTGCVYGGRLTALRYPENELVSVSADRVYCEPVKPLAAPRPARSQQQEHDELLDLADVTGKRLIATRLGGNITIREENSAAALEVMSRFATDPRWLVYLPPTMSPSETSRAEGVLEHPSEAFAYYREAGVEKVVCEEKHMGSRAVVIVCRDAQVAQRRFGVGSGEIGVCFTRTGRRFFSDTSMEAAFLERVARAIQAANLWDELETDWACLDCELMPWTLKAMELVRDQYAAVGAAATAALFDAEGTLRAASSRGTDVTSLLDRVVDERKDVAKYVAAYRRYCWPVSSLDDVKLAPFHLLATEGAVHVGKDHVWHMTTLARLAEASNGLIVATPYRVISPSDASDAASGIAWWEELTERGGEGIVVKPLSFTAEGKRGLLQPAIKSRGREYLRVIYGPHYTAPRNLERLRERGLSGKRRLALREFALGIEALERFVRLEPLRRVHECVFGVLALESEPIDPRL